MNIAGKKPQQCSVSSVMESDVRELGEGFRPLPPWRQRPEAAGGARRPLGDTPITDPALLPALAGASAAIARLDERLRRAPQPVRPASSPRMIPDQTPATRP